jgi:methylated-DNA-protein-cysteine methyltransferase-like protein
MAWGTDIMEVMAETQFKQAVYEVVRRIPAGRVMTYGQVAAYCGAARAARLVGQIAMYGPDDLPWQHVVYKDGRLAGAFPGGRSYQAALLEAEGIEILPDYQVDVNKLLWEPQH